MANREEGRDPCGSGGHPLTRRRVTVCVAGYGMDAELAAKLRQKYVSARGAELLRCLYALTHSIGVPLFRIPAWRKM